jgi:hypothetical protein
VELHEEIGVLFRRPRPAAAGISIATAVAQGMRLPFSRCRRLPSKGRGEFLISSHYIIVGTGGFGGYWCREAARRRAMAGGRCGSGYETGTGKRAHVPGLPPERCYTEPERPDEMRA